jgi:hypothetical protein
VTDRSKGRTLRLSERDRRLLVLVAMRTGSGPEEFALAAALKAASLVVEDDLKHARRRKIPKTGWWFVDAAWLRRNARRLPRLLRRGSRYIVVSGRTPVAFLVGPGDNIDLMTTALCS